MHKVTHLTSVHHRYDTRIFIKMCLSLVNNNYQVNLVVADGKGNEVKDKVSIIDVGASKGKFDRIKNAPRRVLQKAIELDSDLYHLHDPELMPIGLKLKKLGKTVIFDAHEDIPKQILSKSYLNKFSKFFLSKSFALFERWAGKKLDYIVAATPFIRDKYRRLNIKSIDINNYPLIDELSSQQIDWSIKENQVCFIGDMSKIRGILEIIKAINLTKSDTILIIGGSFSDKDLEREAQKEPGWTKVKALGWLDRQAVKQTLANSRAGLVTFLPTPNHIDAQPNKMFEYMSAGIPVIGSNYPLWNQIIEGNNCGICVDPTDPKAIAAAIDQIIADPNKAEEMGRNGQLAVKQKYNWEIEKSKLLDLYQQLLK